MLQMADNQIPIEMRLTQDYSFTYNTLIHVFHHLEIEDLLKVAQVCKLWHSIAYDDNLWHSKIMPSCEKHLAEIIDRFGDKIRNLEIDGLARSTIRSVAKSLRRLPNLKKITLADCRLLKIYQILDVLDPNIVALQIEQTHREYLESYSLDFLKKFPNLSSFGIITFSSIQPHTVKALTNLKKLTHLFLYDEYKNFPYEVFKELTSLRSLQLGGDTSEFLDSNPDYLYSILKDLPNLSKLKVEVNPAYQVYHYDFFRAIDQFPNIRELELHGEIITRHDGTNFIEGIAHLKNIKVLIIEMDPEFKAGRTILDHAIRNSILYKAVLKLKHTLDHLQWLIPGYYVKRVKEIWGSDGCIIFQQSKDLPKELADTFVIKVDKFQKKLRLAMKNPRVFVLVQHYTYRYCPKCNSIKD